jgi:hypothetical protein
VVAGLIGVVVLILASGARREEGSGQPDRGPFAAGSRTISSDSAASSVLLSPIRVEAEFGTAIIAGHIMCKREDILAGNSISDVQAAVAADNDNPPASGAAPNAYAHDVSAQSEIVRASVQELHDDNRFFADCEPVPAATETTVPRAAAP